MYQQCLLVPVQIVRDVWNGVGFVQIEEVVYVLIWL